MARACDGWKQRGIAGFFGVSLKAVSKWVAAHKAGGDEVLASKPHPGAKSKMTRQQERAVQSLLA